ncbi:MAG TPA: hypothetical protein VE684_12410, partial [Crenalkalicoccus sp.]|nr:hypothetical protein [Crenalkalicoccus sp.]
VANLAATVRTADRTSGADTSPAYIWLGADNHIGAVGDPTGRALGAGIRLALDGRSFAAPTNGLANNAVTLREAAGQILTVSGGVGVAGAAAEAGLATPVAPRLTLIADDLTLLATLSAPDGGTVELLPRTPGRSVALGGASGAAASGVLTLDTAELQLIETADGVLRIGRSVDLAVTGNGVLPAIGVAEAGGPALGLRLAGDILLQGDVLLRGGAATPSVTRLELFAGVERSGTGHITQLAGRLDVAELAGESRYETSLGSLANTVDRLVRRTDLAGARNGEAGRATGFAFLAGTAADAAQGGFTFAVANDLAVLGDVQTAGAVAPLSITSGGNLLIGMPGQAGTVEAVSVRAGRSAAGSFTYGSAFRDGTDALRLVAQGSIANNGTLIGTGAVSPQPVGPSVVQARGRIINAAGASIILGWGAPDGTTDARSGIFAGISAETDTTVAGSSDILNGGTINAFRAHAGRAITVSAGSSLAVAQDAIAGGALTVDGVLLAGGAVAAGAALTGGGAVAANHVQANGINLANLLAQTTVTSLGDLTVGQRVTAHDVVVARQLEIGSGRLLDAIGSVQAGRVVVEAGGRLATTSLLIPERASDLPLGGVANSGTIIARSIEVRRGDLDNRGRIEGAAIADAAAGFTIAARRSPGVAVTPGGGETALAFGLTDPSAPNAVGLAALARQSSLVEASLAVTTTAGDLINRATGVITTGTSSAIGVALFDPSTLGMPAGAFVAPRPATAPAPLTLTAGVPGGAARRIVNEAGGRIAAHGNLGLTASGGITSTGVIESLALPGGNGQTGSIGLTAGLDIVQDGGRITTAGTGTTITLRSDGGGVVQSNGALLQTQRLRLLVPQGQVALPSANQFAELIGATVGAPGGRIRGVTYGVTGAVGSVGPLELLADGALSVTAPVTAASTLALSAGSDLAVTGTSLLAGGMLSTTSGGATTLTDSTLRSTGASVGIESQGVLTVAGTLVTADPGTAMVNLRGEGSVRLTRARLDAEQARVHGQTLELDNVTARIGSAILLQAPGGIASPGPLTVTQRDGARLPAVVFDTRLAPGGDPLANVRPDIPGLSANNQPTQVRRPGTQLPGSFGPSSGGPAGPLGLNLDAGNSPVFLLVDGGTVLGTVVAGRLQLHGVGGSMNVTGSLGQFLGVEATRLADITRPIEPGKVQRYRINGCIIASINCVVPPSLQLVPVRPPERVDLTIAKNRIDPSEVIVPNVAEADYE